MNLATTNYMQPPNEVPLSFVFLLSSFFPPFLSLCGRHACIPNLRRVPWKVNIGKLIICRELTQIFHNCTQQHPRPHHHISIKKNSLLRNQSQSKHLPQFFVSLPANKPQAWCPHPRTINDSLVYFPIKPNYMLTL